jgi:hypothetical protein
LICALLRKKEKGFLDGAVCELLIVAGSVGSLARLTFFASFIAIANVEKL